MSLVVQVSNMLDIFVMLYSDINSWSEYKVSTAPLCDY